MQPLNTYIQEIQTELRQAESREHAYRPALKKLLESLGDFHAVNDASHLKGIGAPDFIIKRQDVHVAFVEAKDVGISLSRVERSEQIKDRYLPALPNLVLTDYVEFRWYYKGEKRETARLGDVQDNRLQVTDGGKQGVWALLHSFAEAVIPTVTSAEDLARTMAGMTRHIARLIEKRLPDSRALQGEKTAFEQTLIPNLTDRQFADMYAQTLAYGLFAARVDYTGKLDEFTLKTAFWNLPRTNPFLKRFFEHIAPTLENEVRWQVDVLAEMLANADIDSILAGFGRKTRQEDPIVHFYETFLAEYDPRQRERRGVYYTPEPVVSYIVRSVDYLLREKFGRYDGLADKGVYVLDPATGTGTFLYFVIQQIFERVVIQNKQGGQWGRYVSENLLPRIFGFELLMAPYAVAHMKLGLQLQKLLAETGHKGEQFDERLGVYLTNTLEELNPENQPTLPMVNFITEEGQGAAEVKHKEPIMVVLGNPPYSGHSINRSPWITNLVRDYYQVDGQPLGERNPKWLQDDYVKFIRFGQWRISKTGHGMLAFVTNHSYLDSPTFRGMRQQLMQAFSDIYILNLHGNSLKRETTPDGGRDDNVFDIRQGVAIVILVKVSTSPPGPLSTAWRGGVESAVGGREEQWDGGGVRRRPEPQLWEKLKPLARQMRHEPTPAEQRLWGYLRGRRLAGKKFRRQHAIDRFIVDFFCAETRLVIEVDGPIHDYTQEEDAIRQAYLEEVQGLRVIRFRNEAVLEEPERVLAEIEAIVTSPPGPLYTSQRGGVVSVGAASGASTAAASDSVLSSNSNDLSAESSSPATPPLHCMERGPGGEVARIHYADLWGLRKDKYQLLLDTGIDSTEWQTIEPISPYYLFVPQNRDTREEYQGGWRITEAMSTNVLGFQTHRDHFAVDFDRATMHERIRRLRDERVSDGQLRRDYDLRDSSEWKLADARRQLQTGTDWENNVIQCAYRPFDNRYCYFSGSVMDRPRRELVAHVAHKNNLCLLSPRQQGTVGFRHIWIATEPANDCVISNRSREANQVLPLYLYSEGSQPEEGQALLIDTNDWPLSDKGRRPNLSKAFVDDFAERMGLDFVTEGAGDLDTTFGPESVLYYAYAVFHSPTYRERYAEFLKIDFPRLPLTSDVNLFAELVGYGRQLVQLHLMDRATIGDLMTAYPVAGDDKVIARHPHYDEKHQRVYINKTQYFADVPQVVWEFQVGGYQVLQKWLKDRKGRVLSSEDISHYQQIVVALHKTMGIMEQIDDAIPAWPIT